MGCGTTTTPAAPNLIDITVDGRRIKAVAQVTKQGFVFVFDRVTGKPVWPIEDRPVPTSSVPGERAPRKRSRFLHGHAPIDIQGVHEEDLIDLTPELRKEALDIVAQYDYGPLYTPPSQRGTIQIPGVHGGANWSGAAIDPETGMLYVGTYRLPFVVTVSKPLYGEARTTIIGELRYLPGPRGLPLLKPPFGSLIAIDMNTGEHRWRIPVGRGPADNPAIRHLGIRERLGWPARSWALVTKTVVVVVQMGSSVRLRIAGARRILGAQQSRSAAVGVRQSNRRDARRNPNAAERDWLAGHLHVGGQAVHRNPRGRGPARRGADCGCSLICCNDLVRFLMNFDRAGETAGMPLGDPIRSWTNAARCTAAIC